MVHIGKDNSHATHHGVSAIAHGFSKLKPGSWSVITGGIVMLACLSRRCGMRSGIVGLVGIAVVTSLCAEPAEAVSDPATGALTVSMTITAACTVGTSSMPFGSLPGTTVATTATLVNGSISVTCSTGTVYEIGLDVGANYTGSQRRMINGTTNYILYNLYVSSGTSNPWTTATGATSCTTAGDCDSGTGNGSAQSYTVYGQVPAIAAAPVPGTYNDTVNISVYY